jgi:hypothetical protein
MHFTGAYRSLKGDEVAAGTARTTAIAARSQSGLVPLTRQAPYTAVNTYNPAPDR